MDPNSFDCACGHGGCRASLANPGEVTAVTIVRVGATKKYSDGWESAFGAGKKKSAPAAPKKSAGRKSTKKKAKAKKAAKATK
jgi:hypothetical protein